MQWIGVKLYNELVYNDRTMQATLKKVRSRTSKKDW